MARVVKRKEPTGNAKRTLADALPKIDKTKIPPTALTTLRVFEDFIHPLSDTEFNNLKQAIKKDGEVFDPIKVWNTGDEKYVIDGHHRLKIAKELGMNLVPFREITDLNDRDDALRWMADNQLGRRNITPLMASFLRGMRLAKGQGQKTTQQLAESMGVSKRTLEVDRNIYQALEYIGKAQREWKELLIMPQDENKSEDPVYENLLKVKKGDLQKLGVRLSNGEQVNLQDWMAEFGDKESTNATEEPREKTIADILSTKFKAYSKLSTSKKFARQLNACSSEEKEDIKVMLREQMAEIRSLLNRVENR
ncbi:ParB/RepB/Spo0J family partition protein [Persicobacter psychrovividus]|uniref:ParB-like N-terminal domain-containing protein n=1 Tax=Persicobacter psychrovividus TaxID=387638 RepID=A0ABM7VMZ6_9BACT|nr:hypothetical protein PEPS_46720 [Persicobacter psychrovividus]